MAMTAPGQTAGLSPFTDPLIDELDISRTAISISYFIATLAGAAAMPIFGKAMDRFGSKTAVLVTGLGLAAILYSASFVTEILGLTGAYVGLRLFGQGALSLAATTVIAKNVYHRPGLALGVSGAIGAAGVSLAPVGLERLVSATDIQTAWRIEALLVLAIVIPIAIFLPGRKKEFSPKEFTETGSIAVMRGMNLRQSQATLGFWMVTLAMVAVGLISTAMGFHLISILGEQGLTPFEAASNFLPQTAGALILSVVIGALTDRYHPRLGVIVGMAFLVLALVLLMFVDPGLTSVAFGFLIGGSQGAMRGVETVAFVRYFGRAHIGAIRGFAHAMGLISTALGPILIALGYDLFGSYHQPSLIMIVLPGLVIVLALIDKTAIDGFDQTRGK